MIRIFKTIDGVVRRLQEPEHGCWIALTAPNYTELHDISQMYEIDLDDLKSALDEEERSRIQVEDDYTLLIMDVPTVEVRDEKEYYYTIPFGIIYKDDVIITVCLEDTPILTVFMDGRMRNFSTMKKTRFIYQMVYHNASMFLLYLRIIEKKSSEVEKKLNIAHGNQEIIEMHELEKSLVYITTSLRGNEVVLEKLMRNRSIPRYEDDEELLEDAIIENKQAIEMAKIYTDILNSTMNTFSNIISNNLNIVMKMLSIITIVLTIPTIISSAYGMNVGGIPMATHPHGFFWTCVISVVITIIVCIGIMKHPFFK